MAETLAHQIVDDIMADQLEPGDMLAAEVDMIAAYDVGRATVREALRLLEVQGVITVKAGPGGGPVVARLTPREFADMTKLHLKIRGATYREVLQARVAIEPLMARLAAENRSPSGLDELRQVIAEADEISLKDEAEFYRSSRDFHATVASISGNSVLDLLGASLKEVYEMRMAGVSVRERPEVREIHRAIAQSIFAGEAERAGQLMGAHMLDFSKRRVKAVPGLLDARVDWD